MSSLAAFANLDVDKLIQDIAAQPAIWDKNFNARQNKGYLEEIWDELASSHNAPSKYILACVGICVIHAASSLNTIERESMMVAKIF